MVETTVLDASPRYPPDDGTDVEVVAVLLNPEVIPEPAATNHSYPCQYMQKHYQVSITSTFEKTGFTMGQ